VIRSYAPADQSGVESLLAEAFGADGATIVALVRDLRGSHSRAELVAEEDARIVGQVMLSRSWVDARRALVEVLVLSPLSVAPDRQGHGLGARLLGAALDQARGLEVPAVFLEGSPAYYSRRGFEPATPRGFTRPSARIPEPAFQVAVLDGHESWMVGALVYCEPFWTHDCVGLRDPVLGEVERMFES
jgi:putative acetyltransferase